MPVVDLLLTSKLVLPAFGDNVLLKPSTFGGTLIRTYSLSSQDVNLVQRSVLQVHRVRVMLECIKVLCT